MKKKKGIAVKGVAKLDKKEMNDSKGAGCGVNLGDGVAVFCGSHFIYLDKIYFADVFYY